MTPPPPPPREPIVGVKKYEGAGNGAGGGTGVEIGSGAARSCMGGAGAVLRGAERALSRGIGAGSGIGAGVSERARGTLSPDWSDEVRDAVGGSSAAMTAAGLTNDVSLENASANSSPRALTKPLCSLCGVSSRYRTAPVTTVMPAETRTDFKAKVIGYRASSWKVARSAAMLSPDSSYALKSVKSEKLRTNMRMNPETRFQNVRLNIP